MPSFFLGLADWITSVIASVGYTGIFLLMLVEGVITPIPSEFIVPFAGYLAARGEMSFGLVVLAATMGAAAGNSIAYAIGYRVGRPLIERHGRLLRLGPRDVAWAESWFARYGTWGILVGHVLPGIRSFISFPAGIGRMGFRRFVILSTIGAAIHNTVLAAAGFLLFDGWRAFAEATENVDAYVAIAAVVSLIGYVYWHKRRQTRSPAANG